MTEIIQCLEGILPQDQKEARRARIKSGRYCLKDGVLYRRSLSLPLLRCLSPGEAEAALEEIYRGVCGNHPGARTLAHSALRAGFYWPIMQADARGLVRNCAECQRFACISRTPATEISVMQSPCLFSMWGMDLLGPFLPAAGQRKFLIVAVEYFTKWVEAEALATITEEKVERFFYRQVICRFGLPRVLVTDNGRQFDNVKFRGLSESSSVSPMGECRAVLAIPLAFANDSCGTVNSDSGARRLSVMTLGPRPTPA